MHASSRQAETALCFSIVNPACAAPLIPVTPAPRGGRSSERARRSCAHDHHRTRRRKIAPMITQTIRGEAFAALHRRPSLFAIPNPWDAGSAKLLAALGFEAL